VCAILQRGYTILPSLPCLFGEDSLAEEIQYIGFGRKLCENSVLQQAAFCMDLCWLYFELNLVLTTYVFHFGLRRYHNLRCMFLAMI